MVNEFTFVWRIISHILDKLYDNYFKEDSHKLHIFLPLYKQRGLRKTLISLGIVNWKKENTKRKFLLCLWVRQWPESNDTQGARPWPSVCYVTRYLSTKVYEETETCWGVNRLRFFSSPQLYHFLERWLVYIFEQLMC